MKTLESIQKHTIKNIDIKPKNTSYLFVSQIIISIDPKNLFEVIFESISVYAQLLTINFLDWVDKVDKFSNFDFNIILLNNVNYKNDEIMKLIKKLNKR